MNAFTSITHTLTQRPKRTARPQGPTDAKPNKTKAMRDHLQNAGPATAEELAEVAGLDRIDLVSALLGKDLLRGLVHRQGGQYHFNHQYASSQRAGDEDMARRLRLNGWAVTPPATSRERQGPHTETITWVEVIPGCAMPEPFEDVLIDMEDGHGGVWAGYWGGDSWCGTSGERVELTVCAWACFPVGQKGATT
jgi:hypothetical protein